MKHVVKSAQVAHLWANQSQYSARTPSRNMYFKHDTIYSYGSHFPIARHTTCRGEGRQRVPCVLFTTRGYSKTTNCHKSDVWHALSGHAMTVFNVFNVLADSVIAHKENYRAMEREAADYGAKAEKARQNKPRLLQAAYDLIRTMNEYARAFGLRVKPIPAYALDVLQQRIDTEKKKADKLHSAAITKREKEAAALRVEALKVFPAVLEAWQHGKDLHAGFHGDNERHIYAAKSMLRDTVYFRIARDGATVQTSLGDEVPAKAARLLWDNLNALVYEAPGTPAHMHAMDVLRLPCSIGAFEIHELEISHGAYTGNFKAGCHNVKFEQVAQFASSQGW